MKRLIWVGKYESDIAECICFQGSITYYGSNQGNNTAFSGKSVRIHSKRMEEYKRFIIQSMERLLIQHPHTYFLYYNQSLAYEISAMQPKLAVTIVGLNLSTVIDSLNNKIYNRLWFSNMMPTTPFKAIPKEDCDFEHIQRIFPQYEKFVVQKNFTSGGKGTFLLTKESNANIQTKLEVGEIYIVSPYIEKSVPVNIHLCITDTDVILFPESIQLTETQNDCIFYRGADYISAKKIPDKIRTQMHNEMQTIGCAIKHFGYRGVLGVDLLLTHEKAYFIEINPRFQGSSIALNKSLLEKNLPSLYELHMNAFDNSIRPEEKIQIENIHVNYSLLIYMKNRYMDSTPYLYPLFKADANTYILYEDGFSRKIPVDFYAYLFRVLIRTSISSITSDNSVNIAENLLDKDILSFPLKNKSDVITLKIALLIQGVIVSDDAIKYISAIAPIKSATFNAIDVTIFDDLKINCPVNIPFSDLSPYHIEYDPLNRLCLYYKNMPISRVSVDTNENIQNRTTKSGIPYSSIGFRTNDRVRIRHTAMCYYKEHGQSCSFCESPHSEKDPFQEDDIFEVIDAYEKEISFRHYLIGGASERRDSEPETIKKIIAYIRQKSQKPIYLMSLPPKNMDDLYDYRQMGLNEVAFNIEIFDRELAKQLMPGKGQIPLEDYTNALSESVKLWGNTGNVRSMLILGLEKRESLMQGIKTLCALGVSPMLSIFRPMPNTSLRSVVPPSVQEVKNFYDSAYTICEQYNVNLGPTCKQCQNNTLALPLRYLTDNI